MTVKHATFTLERTYAAPVEKVFAAWSDPAAKAAWFAVPGGQHELDFRVGGREVNRGSAEQGAGITFEARYEDIVEGARIVYSGLLSAAEVLSTISITTVEFAADGEGTRLVLAEQATFLDGHEEPGWREQGTGDWLDKLGVYVG